MPRMVQAESPQRGPRLARHQPWVLGAAQRVTLQTAPLLAKQPVGLLAGFLAGSLAFLAGLRWVLRRGRDSAPHLTKTQGQATLALRGTLARAEAPQAPRLNLACKATAALNRESLGPQWAPRLLVQPRQCQWRPLVSMGICLETSPWAAGARLPSALQSVKKECQHEQPV